ncbi:MAG: 50S ribosomal protein L15 [Phycisphaerae bacterium]|nr:50S ribosomal protein L15 [Phycisphaerae bacterium]
MKLDEILSTAGRNKRRRRVGRGDGSGNGKTCGRGHKGYGSRAGAKRQFGFEGGQTPALARMPKRGFSNARFRRRFQIVNVASLEAFEAGQRVDAAALAAAGLIDDADKPVKILANGEISKKLAVVATAFTAAAVKKIEDAGGSTEQS